MEEFKARKIIENLESIAAEKGADAMTNEIIEDCCKANGVAPEDFRDFICENIDLQKLKELQGLEELSLKKLDQVAGGARPIKQGIASLLTATSLLGSATNFTGAVANGREQLSELTRVKLSAETPRHRRREKPQRRDGHPWEQVTKAVGIGSLIISATYIAKWLLSPTKSDVKPTTPQRADGALSSDNRAAKYARFKQLLDNFKDIESFRTQISSDFQVTSTAISDLQESRCTTLTLFDTDDIKAEIGEDNIAALKTKLRQCLKSARGAGRANVPAGPQTYPASYTTASSYVPIEAPIGGAQPPQLPGEPYANTYSYSYQAPAPYAPPPGPQNNPASYQAASSYVPSADPIGGVQPQPLPGEPYPNTYSYNYQGPVPYAPAPGPQTNPASCQAASSSAPAASFETTQVRDSAAAVDYSDYGYSLYQYTPPTMNKKNAGACRSNQQSLTKNVNSGIALLGLDPKQTRTFAGTFFGGIDNDPRRGIVDYIPRMGKKSYPLKHLSAEHEYVYNVPDRYCKVYDYSLTPPIKVETDTCENEPAKLWWVEQFTLPALFAVDKQLRLETQDERGLETQDERGLDVDHTVVLNAGNATSPGGDILKGDGTQEESLMLRTCAFLFLNSKSAYNAYYTINRNNLKKIRDAKKGKHSASAVTSWDETGIIDRTLYTRDVPLIKAKHGEKINMITIAAADYNPGHDGTFMGPITPDPEKPKEQDLLAYMDQLIRYWNTVLRAAYSEKDKNLILTMGGCGAYKGKAAKLTAALFKVLTEYGPDKHTCWARCFDNIIFAAKSENVLEPLYDPYRTKFGSTRVRYIGPN